MKNRQKIIKKIISFGIIILLFPQPAYAYLDPGTGSYLLQIIAAGFFATLFLFRGWWKKVQAFFVKISRRVLSLRKTTPKNDEQNLKKSSNKKG